MEQQRAIAESIVSYLVDDDAESLKLICATTGDDEAWRSVFRHELVITEIIHVGGLLQYDIVVPKLVFWGTTTISGYHLAALRGVVDILTLCVRQFDIGVDVRLESGVTALHVASFNGQLDVIKLLIDELEADVNATDKYGWTALHYAAVEGQFSAVELLISRSANVGARDLDGASAAFRAHTVGHEDIVCLLGSVHGDTDDLLNIAEDDDYAETQQLHKATGPAYAVVNKLHSGSEKDASSNEAIPDVPSSSSSARPEVTDVRRIISEQLANVLGNDESDSSYQVPVPYEQPMSLSSSSSAARSRASGGLVGYNTLTRVVREELQKYRESVTKRNSTLESGSQNVPPSNTTGLVQHDITDSDEMYDEIIQYEPIGNPGLSLTSASEADGSVDYELIPEPHYPPPPVHTTSDISRISLQTSSRHNGPPLPRRGNRSELVAQSPVLFQALRRIDKSAAVMDVCFIALMDYGLNSPDDWKKLGRSLPFCSGSGDRVEKKLRTVEQQYPDDRRAQVTAVLRAWRKWRGERANMEALLAALQRCGMTNEVAMLEETVDQSSA